MGPDVPTLPITVLGGYLGSGKTTLLNSVLRRAHGQRLGVIVNDFGELGIDAALVADAVGSDDGVINLANGCVCCTLGDDLGTALQTLAASEPPLDQIIIEASGVADPRSAAAWGTVPPFSPGGVIVLAAADTIEKQVRDRYVGAEVRRQLTGADVVVLTKTDRCPADEVSAVRSWMATQTQAPVIEGALGNIPLDVMTAVSAERSPQPPADTPHEDELATAYVTWSFVAKASATTEGIRTFLDALPEGLLRLKGRAGDSTVNVVGRRVDMTPTSANEGVRLEAIGLRSVLDVSLLDRLASRHLRAD